MKGPHFLQNQLSLHLVALIWLIIIIFLTQPALNFSLTYDATISFRLKRMHWCNPTCTWLHGEIWPKGKSFRGADQQFCRYRRVRMTLTWWSLRGDCSKLSRDLCSLVARARSYERQTKSLLDVRLIWLKQECDLSQECNLVRQSLKRDAFIFNTSYFCNFAFRAASLLFKHN